MTLTRDLVRIANTSSPTVTVDADRLTTGRIMWDSDIYRNQLGSIR